MKDKQAKGEYFVWVCYIRDGGETDLPITAEAAAAAKAGGGDAKKK